MNRKMKALSLSILMLCMLLLTGCGNKQEKKEEQGNVDGTNKPITSVKKEPADIDKIAAENVFYVNWFTQEGEYSAGTAFLIDSPKHGEKVLVTAFHFLWPADAEEFTGVELPEFVQGGELRNIYSNELTTATLKSNLVIEDASVAPNIDKDVAAFTLHNAGDLNTLSVATEPSKAGDTVYLLASLWNTDDIHENCVYEGKVIEEEDGILFYELDEKYGTAGASGAPLVNQYGEVVGIHIGSNGSTRFANAATSFTTSINSGTESEVEYPAQLPSIWRETQENTEQEIVSLHQNDVLASEFFDLKINKISVTDELNTYVSDEYKFLILEVQLSTKATNSTDPVDMFDIDFWVEWGEGTEDFDFPLEPEFTPNQLPEEYVILPNVSKVGDLVFLIPIDSMYVDLVYQDYFQWEDSTETHDLDLYRMRLDLTEINQ